MHPIGEPEGACSHRLRQRRRIAQDIGVGEHMLGQDGTILIARQRQQERTEGARQPDHRGCRIRRIDRGDGMARCREQRAIFRIDVLQRVLHVAGGERVAVLPFGVCEMESVVQPVGGNFPGFRQCRLDMEALHHPDQTFVDHAADQLVGGAGCYSGVHSRRVVRHAHDHRAATLCRRGIRGLSRLCEGC